MDQTNPRIKTILRIAEETGLQDNYTALAKELNRRGVKTLRGKLWTRWNLDKLCTRHGFLKSAPDLPADETEPSAGAPSLEAITSIKQANTPRPTRPATKKERTRRIADQPTLDADTVVVLKEVADWWTRTKGAEMPASPATQGKAPTTEPVYRPRFPGKRTNTGIRVNKRLLDDALKKAETATGGGISPLVEWLLWRYLEFDPKYLRKDDE